MENTQCDKKENLRDQAYHIIKSKIITGELASGEMVDEKKLIVDLKIGRTPIREAISALTQEDIIVVVPRKGTYVRKITVEDIANLFQVRELMEPFIVSLITPGVSCEMLGVFRDNFSSYKSLTSEEIFTLDNQFHRYLAIATGNSYVVHMMENIYFQDHRLRYLATTTTDQYESSAEHIEIIDLMLKRDVVNAQKKMREHICGSRKIAMSLGINSLELF